MKRHLPLALLLSVGLLVAGCDATGLDDTSGVVTLSGQVLHAETNNPVPQAFVRVLPFDLLYEADAEGRYRFDVEIDSTMELGLTATKDGFGSSSTDVLALAGRAVDVPTLRLTQVVEEERVSGQASNVLLLSQSTETIGVRESGSQEVAQLVFQVADSLGRPVVLDHAADVRFRLGVAPGGGEFVHPATARTDNNGQVTVNLSSGTRAGVVQVYAEADVAGRTLRSNPVAVTIHGGLPDQTHFSLGPERFNFPGLRRHGLTNPVSVVVGDRYGNPARPGTSVYFESTHGVIVGSTTTDAQGEGTVNLLSGNPLPADGVALVTARTADDAGTQVSASTPVLFTGVPVVEVTPAAAQLGQTYTLRVTDPNGNPLAEGTTIGVRAEGTKVKATGHTAVTLDDTAFIGGTTYAHVQRGPGITEFTFRVVENLGIEESGTPAVETVVISVAGPNGALDVVLSAAGAGKTASVTPASVTPGFDAAVDRLAGGGLRARLVE